MTLKDNARFQRKLTPGLKNDKRNLVKFHANSLNTENLLSDGLLFPNNIDFRQKCTEELSLMTLKSDANFEEKRTFRSKNDMRNLVKYNVVSSKSKHLHFNIPFLSIAYKVPAKNLHKKLSLMKLKSDSNFEEKLTF